MQGVLKKLVNDKALWDAYIEFLDDKIHKAHVRLEQATQVDAMHRIQGELSALRRLKLMREEVNGQH